MEPGPTLLAGMYIDMFNKQIVFCKCLSLTIGTLIKQTGRQHDDDGYSHNDIPDLVQKK
jgi:hypothetical protein